MYARSSSFQAQPTMIDAGIAIMRDAIMPALMDIDGCVGLSLLVNRDSGRCIATSAWQDADAMRASAARVTPIRDRATEAFGASGAAVEEWEIPVLHREHQSASGACVRVTWMHGDPAQVDPAIESVKTISLPAAEALEGFCSASLMVNRKTGRAVLSATYDSRDAMVRTREQASALRSSGTLQAGAQVTDVAEFELALAHLRVPEMA
jgi:quinol monooxygenase YgiN